MIRIKYNGHDKHLQLAVGTVNSLLTDFEFYTHIANRSQFDMANIPSEQLATLIRKTNLEMRVEFYYSILPFSNAITYDDIDSPGTIWLNKWNIDRPIDFLCNALMHQCVHAANSLHPEYYFGHGDNDPYGKENTAPYWIAALAQRMFLRDESQPCDYLLHEDMQNIPKRMLQPC
jgi:hypothetical protein